VTPIPPRASKIPEEIRPDRPETIRRMFERLAPDYDRLNTLLTFGLDGGWRRAMVRAAGIGPGDRVLDVGAGTGRSLAEVRRAVGPGGLAVGVDFTEAMLRRAAGVRVLADAMVLPFPDSVFDAVVSAFALRDVADQRRVLEEMARVVKPGGRVAILEIGRPAWGPARVGFDLWFRGAVPRLAALFGQGQSHRFLVRSVDYLPAPDDLLDMMRSVGLVDVRLRDLSLGTTHVFAGRK
jgi:demethylmenaquinone methyltransferase / 2-methoxy-6-polyprenyl-1,4-benzoquinol methylase